MRKTGEEKSLPPTRHDLLSLALCALMRVVRKVSDAATVTDIFSDGRQLEVVPLLQAFMFPAW